MYLHTSTYTYNTYIQSPPRQVPRNVLFLSYKANRIAYIGTQCIGCFSDCSHKQGHTNKSVIKIKHHSVLLNVGLKKLEIRLLLKHFLQLQLDLQVYCNMALLYGTQATKFILTTQSLFKTNFYFSPQGISDGSLG